MYIKNFRQRLKNKLFSSFYNNQVGRFLEQSRYTAHIRRAPFKAGSAWDALIDPIVTEVTNAPATFLRQPTVTPTVHPNQIDLAKRYLDQMVGWPFFQTHLLPRMHDLPMGNPYLCPFFPLASPMTIQVHYYLCLIHQYFGLDFSDTDKINHITEIGGGYGNTCRILQTLGYTQKYIIVDLPEMHDMQRHYLSYAVPRLIEENRITFARTDETAWIPTGPGSFLFGTFSVCEFPMSLRTYLEQYYAQFDYLFFAYYIAYDGVENVPYFTSLEQKLSSTHKVHHFQDPARRAWFLLAERK